MTDAPPNAGITITAKLPADLSIREARAILMAIIEQHGTAIIPPLSLSVGEVARITKTDTSEPEQAGDVFDVPPMPKKQPY